MNEKEALHESIAKMIAGDVVLAEDPGAAIGKWRSIFKIPQYLVAERMHVMPSVISDYESGRRKSPGATMIKKLVGALIAADEEMGSNVSREFGNVCADEKLNDAILDVRELAKEISMDHIVPAVKGTAFAEGEDMEKNIRGYAILDSVKTIMSLSPSSFMNLRNLSSERALVFVGIDSGKSCLVAMKLANVKPTVVILHGPKKLDVLAERIAKIEKIPVIVSGLSTVDELIAALKGF